MILLANRGLSQDYYEGINIELGHLEYDTNDVNNILEESKALANSNYESANQLLDTAFQMAINLDYKRGIAKYFMRKAFFYGNLNQIDSAKLFLNIGLEICEEMNYPDIESRMYYTWGNLNYFERDFYYAIKHHNQAIEIYKKIGDARGEGLAMNMIGNIYLEQKEDAIGEEYYRRVLSVTKNIPDSNLFKLIVWNNLASMLAKSDNIDSTVYYNKKSLNILLSDSNLLKKKYRLPLSYTNLSSAYMLADDYDKAVPLIYKSLSLLAEIGDDRQKLRLRAINHLNLAIYHSKKGETAIAEQYFDSSYKSNAENGFNDIQETVFENQYEHYKTYGKFDLALAAHENFLMYKDSSASKIQNQLVQDLKVKHQSEKKEAEIARLTEDQKIKSILIGGLVVIILLMILFVVNLVSRLRQRRTLQIAMSDKIDAQNKELTSMSLFLSEKQSIYEELSEKLNKIKADANYDNILEMGRSMKKKLKTEQGWDQFTRNFTRVHPQFIDQLGENFEKLTTNDKKLCAFIKMHMGNKDIASILNINVNSVKQSKTRLKKKLGLEAKDDLNSFIQSI
ncbi:MAG: hypothetical protein MRY83_07550 [Flavobacteriales bacterium]|nr:hypothetical protein [Flavobacteriales bacterium]